MTRRVIIVTAVLLSLSVWTHARQRAAMPHVDVAAALPLAFGEWIGRDAPALPSDVVETLAADQYVHRYYGYANDGWRTADRGPRIADVEIDVAYYARPQVGAAMHSPLNCLPGNGWTVVESRMAPLSDGQRTSNVRQLIVARGADRVAMTYWFQNRGAMVGSEYHQRLQLLANGFQGRHTDAALVRVMALDTSEGHAAMNRFSREVANRFAAVFK